MKQIMSIREIQLIELEILKQFKQFCDNNHIQYYLMYGTLIGTIRHKGFIPWDDDIDVVVLRKDYDRLIKLLKENRSLGSEQFYAHIPNDKNYCFPFIKIVNKNTVVYESVGLRTEIWIDVFPLDFLSDIEKERKKTYDKISKYNYNGHISFLDWEHCKQEHPNNRFLQFIRWILLHMIGTRFFVRKVSSGRLFGKHGKAYIGNLVWNYVRGDATNLQERERYPIEAFSIKTEVEFEGEMFTVPNGYDEVLKIRYGDYMVFPPEKEQKGHNIKAYYIE